MSLLDQMNELLPSYEEYMNEKNIIESSKETYILRLRKFIEYLDKVYINPPSKIEYITDEHVNTFLSYKIDEGSALVSCDGYLSNIKAFFRFLYERGTLKNFILYNTTLNRDWKKNMRDYDTFSKSEIYIILEYAKKLFITEPNFNNVRNYTIILMIVYATLTLNEIHMLNVSDINLQERCLHLKTKNERTIYVSDFIADVLEEYLEIRNKYTNTDYFLVSRQQNRLAKKSIQDVVKKVIIDSGIPDKGRKLCPNTIRNTAIKTMVESGVEIPIICNISGLDMATLVRFFDTDSQLSHLKEQLYLEGHPLLKDTI